MATAPQYAATAKPGAVTLSATPNTTFGATAPANAVTIYTAGSSGSKVEQIRLTQIVTTSAPGLLLIWLFDGTNYHLWDAVAYVALTLSTTVPPVPVDKFYKSLVLASGWSIAVTNTVGSGPSSTAATHKAIAMAGDF